MRAYASASIAFGLVRIPVKFYAAVESSADVSFNLLHKTCHSRLKQQYECIKENVVVERAAMVKGYEFEKDKYVTFTPEELALLEEEADDTIEILEFVALKSVDTMYFDRRSLVGPDKGADRSYKLLARAMTKAKRAAVARFSSRGKSHLVLFIAVGDKLVMQQLHYADGVRSLDEVPVEDVEVTADQVQLATQIIKQLEQPKFDARVYHDEVKVRVRERIQAKIDGREIAVQPSDKKGAQIIDLAEALKASVANKRRPRRDAGAATSSKGHA